MAMPWLKEIDIDFFIFNHNMLIKEIKLILWPSNIALI